MISLLIYLACFLLLVVLVLMFFYIKERQGRVSALESHHRERALFSQQAEQARSEQQALLADKIRLGNQLAEQKTHNANLKRQLQEQLATHQQLAEENRLQFEALSNRLLDEKAEKFTRQNQNNLDQLLKPLQEKIKDFEKKVEETYQRESNERFSLKNELQRTFALNQTLSEQANNLTNALRADTRKQGNWGEYLLEKILESAGLQEEMHYRKQVAFQTDEGAFRPDIILDLPEHKHLVIDAKVSLRAYERYFNAPDEQSRTEALQQHLRSVRSHIDQLGSKNYDRLMERTPDFVLMFIAVEPAYNLALMNSPELYELAYRKKVILVSVSSLMATLRIVESLWRLEKQNKNAHKVVEEGNKLYEKLAGFVADMESMGQKIGSLQTAYDQAMSKLTTGRGNLIRRAENMRRLGLNPTKQLPENLRDQS